MGPDASSVNALVGGNIYVVADVLWLSAQQAGREGKCCAISVTTPSQCMLGPSGSAAEYFARNFKLVQGRVFLDRDPKHFRLILNYLRDGNVCLPNCSIELHEILQEAMFYQVSTCMGSTTQYCKFSAVPQPHSMRFVCCS